ncbi:MAG TPA: FAD:protein FMN transferase [Cellvibrionaceae bacterium]|nr:FAD:protein FMN transferase [Cellvibrionaceae bacterium]
MLAKRMRPLLGCFVEIALPVAADDAIFTAAFAQIELIHQLLSFHSSESDLTRLNRANGKPVLCHPLSLQCLRLARAITFASGGAFNFALGGQLIRCNALPDHDFAAIYGADQLVAVGSWRDLTICGQTACLKPGVIISLDGIAKGFAVDAAVKLIQAAHVQSGWINAGGDIRVFGEQVLAVSIRDHEGNLHAKGGLRDAAIATSTTCASAEFPGWVLDAQGQSLAAATIAVIAHKAWRADALTKVAAATPVAQRADVVGRLGGRWVPVP